MSSLEHHGIKGQKWGVRRFQNPDGTRTSEGKKRESKYVFKDTDYRVLDGKRVLSRIQAEDVSLEHPFYATYTDHDIKKYAGLYGYSLLRRSRSEAVKKLKSAIKSGNVSDIDAAKGRLDASGKMIIYQNKLAINSDIRIPSKKRASEITADLLRRKSFKQNVEKSIEYSKDRLVRPQQQIVFNKALRILKEKDTSELSDRDAAMVYTAFNISLTFHDKNSIAAQNKFYSELKKYGYGAISDINDKKYSSFHAEDPLIIFDLDKIQPNKLAPLEQKEMAAYYRRYNAERIVKEISTFGINTMREVVGRDYLYHLGGSMNYIYGNTLVLGDSSYLEHHGIKGQRWGVRRFQNKDGSLTNAGRKRLGYSTKDVKTNAGRKRLGYSTKDVKTALVKGGKAVGGAAVTIGKAGYNLGKKATAAGKAHSEKKKAEELKKKKEKAAKTRLGVVRNADLFTAAEMAELNKKFKAKDEMTLASLQKGADYCRLAAGMIGSVASINKDFESMTGKSLIPNPIKKEKEKREAAERAEDRARKLAKEDAEEDRKRRADERKSKADDIDFKNKSEDLKNKQSEELRKQAAEARAQAKQTWDEDFAKEKTRAMKGTADENEAKAAVKRQELKTNEIAQREEAVAKREAATKSQEEQNEANRKLILNYARDLDTLRDTLNKATNELKNADNVTEQRRKEIWEAIKKAQDDALKHDDMDKLYLEHHGIKGQRWGVRRFQNPDGTLTDKGRKHYQKKLDREKRKQVSSDYLRGTLERQHGIAVGASGVISAIGGALTVAAVVSNPATIAAGAAIAAAVSAGITHGSYSIAEAWEGRGSRIRKKRIAKYENMLKQDAFFVEDGTLHLEHFGIKNMKWGVRRFQNKDGSLTEAGKKRYGSGEELSSGGGGGGGAPEEDEEMKKKIEEAAKKAGMTVAEYRKKYANVIANMKQAAKNVKKTAKNVKEDVSLAAEDAVDAVTGKQSKRLAEGWARNAQKHEKQAQEEKEKYISEGRKRGGGDNSVKDDHRLEASRHEDEAKKAHDASNYWRQKYDKSLGGRYEKLKATMAERGKAKKKEAGEQKRKGRTDQYIAGPEQNKNTKHLLDTEYSKRLRSGANRKSRDAAIYGKAADEAKRKQASALNRSGSKGYANQLGRDASSLEKAAKTAVIGDPGMRGARDYKKAYDKTAQGKLDKARYAVQRTKQKVYNAAGGEYKRQADLGRVYLKREKAKENRAIKRGNSYDAEAARTWQDVYRKSTNEMERAYEKSIAGRYDKLKATITERGKAKGSSQIPTKNSSPDQSPTNRPVSREKTKRAVKGSIKVGERHHRSTTSQQGIKQGEKHEGLRTHTLPKMKSLTATAKPMRKLTSKELSKIRSEARVKQLKKDGDYTGEYKKKRRK